MPRIRKRFYTLAAKNPRRLQRISEAAGDGLLTAKYSVATPPPLAGGGLHSGHKTDLRSPKGGLWLWLLEAKPRFPNLSLTGFTLVELIVVIVIVAVLSAISLPIFEKTVDEAHKKEAESILNTLRSAEQMYFIDFISYYSAATFTTNAAGNSARRALGVSVYDSEDWAYSVNDNGFTGTAAVAVATATRRRGRHINDIFSMNVSSGVTAKYTW